MNFLRGQVAGLPLRGAIFLGRRYKRVPRFPVISGVRTPKPPAFRRSGFPLSLKVYMGELTTLYGRVARDKTDKSGWFSGFAPAGNDHEGLKHCLKPEQKGNLYMLCMATV